MSQMIVCLSILVIAVLFFYLFNCGKKWISKQLDEIEEYEEYLNDLNDGG